MSIFEFFPHLLMSCRILQPKQNLFSKLLFYFVDLFKRDIILKQSLNFCFRCRKAEQCSIVLFCLFLWLYYFLDQNIFCLKVNKITFNSIRGTLKFCLLQDNPEQGKPIYFEITWIGIYFALVFCHFYDLKRIIIKKNKNRWERRESAGTEINDRKINSSNQMFVQLIIWVNNNLIKMKEYEQYLAIDRWQSQDDNSTLKQKMQHYSKLSKQYFYRPDAPFQSTSTSHIKKQKIKPTPQPSNLPHQFIQKSNLLSPLETQSRLLKFRPYALIQGTNKHKHNRNLSYEFSYVSRHERKYRTKSDWKECKRFPKISNPQIKKEEERNWNEKLRNEKSEKKGRREKKGLKKNIEYFQN